MTALPVYHKSCSIDPHHTHQFINRIYDIEAQIYKGLLHLEGSELAGVNLSEILFTQWRSSVGVRKPSPLNTCPRCPPQAAHVISTLIPSGSG